VRSSGHYDETVAFYRDVLGLTVIGSFHGSYGEDGTMFGLPGVATHLEIVRAHGGDTSGGADTFDQIVFYLPDADAVHAATAPLRHHGLTPSPAHPYWEANGGVVFLDPDGRGVVFAPWIFGRDEQPADREPDR
jgi:catechol 2,3-dioxygenase-like lactoylglutathione lyase family enzyme